MSVTLDVVMPIGPGEQIYFESALRSVLAAEVVKQVVLVLDGREFLPEVITPVSDPRIKVFVNPGPRGIGSAMNFGVAQSTSDLIAIMHSDDVSHPLRFEAQLIAMKGSPEFVAMGTLSNEPENLPNIDPDILSAVKVNPMSAEQLLNQMPLTNPSTIFRKSALIQVHGYRYSMTSMEDYELLLRLGSIGQVGVLPLVLHGYRTHSDQQSRKHRAFREWWWVFIARLGLAKSGQVSYAKAIHAQISWMIFHLKLSFRYRAKLSFKRDPTLPD